MLKKYLSLNLLALVLFIADRIVKIYFIKNPAVSYSGDFFYGLISFHFEKNLGMAFGILLNQSILISLISFIIIILFSFLVRAYQQNSFWEVSSLTLIISGAISNLFDRLKYNFVVDYIDLKFFTVFNLADIMITFGVIFLLTFLFFNQEVKNLKSFDKGKELR